MSYTRDVTEAFDFTTTQILDWELEAIRKDSIEILPEGITMIICNVPTKFIKDQYNTEYEAHSIAVAMRLEELTNQALEIDATSGTVHEF